MARRRFVATPGSAEPADAAPWDLLADIGVSHPGAWTRRGGVGGLTCDADGLTVDEHDTR